ncbi:MAG: acyl-CoA ligase (AMP-forming), exosortase A system-associated [Steroidobacteraceae bacterium]|nr:acyl-CoA ligase (AMP-forming), exosortase A system-associated [Steroidobacteraceae bacterium]
MSPASITSSTLLHDLVDAGAANWGAREALRHRHRGITYAELAERSSRIAVGLAARGVRRGDRVVVHLQNRPEVVELALATSRLGAIFVPANPLLRGRQLRHILQDSGARALVCTDTALGTVAELGTAHGLATLIVCDEIDSARRTHAAVHRYEELLEERAHDFDVRAIDRDPAALLYTSGSTGKPKAVVVSHRNLLSGASIVAGYLGNKADDRLCAALPLSFDYGFSQVTTAFTVGACAVLANYSTAAALIQEVAAEKITGLAGVPTMWAHLAEGEWPQSVVDSLRYITNSGGVFPIPALRKLQKRLVETRVFCMYGLTEAFRSTYLDPAQLANRPGSMGKAIPNQEVLVLRPDGSRCGPDEPGELVHRGSLVTLGYWNDIALTRHRFRPVPGANAGLCEEYAVWSGDLVRADAEGYLYFIGRADQQIKSSGHRVSPSEIEEVVLEVPHVIEAVAVGLPDDVLGARIAVAVVGGKQSGSDLREDIRQHCRKHLPSYMVPAHVQIVDAIARNANGKPDRAAVAAALERFAAASGGDNVHAIRPR